MIAVHERGGYVPRWREVAEARGFEVRVLDGLSPGIVRQLSGCAAFLWHLDHETIADMEFARGILLGAETAGIKVFPNHATSWHFDDKIGQKYLLEAIDAPLAPTWVFFCAKEALEFLKDAEYPLVFKLRRGAGSLNVHLVRDHEEGAHLVRRMFGRGVRPFPAVQRMRRAAQRGARRLRQKDAIANRAVRVIRRILRQAMEAPRERGYALFQRFIPGNDHDIRVTVIGERCFVFRREVRPDDFRASGSGRISYLGQDRIPNDVMDIARTISRRLGFQSMAYDFVREPGSSAPVLLEISYSFMAEAVAGCPGYLGEDGRWRPGSFWPQDAILEDLLS